MAEKSVNGNCDDVAHVHDGDANDDNHNGGGDIDGDDDDSPT